MAYDDPSGIVKAVTAAVLKELRGRTAASFVAPVGVSGRHLHLTAGDFGTLFGRDALLTIKANLTQPGQFAAAETVTVLGPEGFLPKVRIVGPTRPHTVVELTAGDLIRLGVKTIKRAGEPFGVIVAGPAGVLNLPAGGVISPRHLHVTPTDANKYGLIEGQTVAARVGIPGRRVTLEDVLVRIAAGAALEFHLDRDEANACGVSTGDDAEVIVRLTPTPHRSVEASRARRTLVTEADVMAAAKKGEVPDLVDAIVTPSARDALRKYFPNLGVE